MTQSIRALWLPFAIAVALALAAGGVLARADNAPTSPQVLADESPEASPGASPDAQSEALSEQNVTRIVGLLEDAGVVTEADAFTALAADLGVGGAVRALAWANATEDGTTAEDIVTMRADGMGWGVIRKELDPDGELGLRAGIGWIMRGASSSGGASVSAEGAVTDSTAAEAAGGGKDHGKGKPDSPGQHGRDKAAKAHSSGN